MAKPAIHWVRLIDAWHVELVPGAIRTRCDKPITAEHQRSTKAKPTHCQTCLQHWRDAVAKARGETSE